MLFGKMSAMSARMKVILFAFVTVALFLTIKLFYLQVLSAANLSKSAASQRYYSSVVEVPRGDILDRNGIQLTNREIKYTVALKTLDMSKYDIDGANVILPEIARILNADETRLFEQLSESRPVLIAADRQKAEALLSLETDCISVIYSLDRYGKGSVAKHVIGYLNKKDQAGQAGIEKHFEDVLKESTSKRIGIIKDAGNNPVKGKGYKIIDGSTDTRLLNVKLTIDYHIQKIVEDAAKKAGITGAVVVEDVNTGDIVAMASFPDFDQSDVVSYLYNMDKPLYNRATAAYNPGSVFKIITAAVFIESGINQDDMYYCNGSIKAGGNTFKCTSYEEGGHGLLNMELAFAHSCNTYFINYALKSGYRNLINMASEFGLGRLTGIGRQGVAEEKGNLPDAGAYYSSGDIANISIGQGAVLATPLQIADIVATIANGGIKNRINIVDSILDRNGNKVRDIRVDEGSRILPKSTVTKLKDLMEAVTIYGTGQEANIMKYGGAAGKTGSAQTGKPDVVHAWFAGYFPLNEPKYSMVVLAENGKYGGKTAAPVFAEIASQIMEKGY